MRREAFYGINNPDIVFEYFDDETVIINLKNGNYYNINRSGTDILSFIEQKLTIDQIIAEIKKTYDSAFSSQLIDSEVKKFIEQLLKEKIIRREETPLQEKNPDITKEAERSKNCERIPFSPPSLNKYTDMQELLLLDPIHDVDETGWPKKKNNASESDNRE